MKFLCSLPLLSNKNTSIHNARSILRAKSGLPSPAPLHLPLAIYPFPAGTLNGLSVRSGGSTAAP